MSQGPLLYDEDPETPFTGTPRSRRGLLVALGVGTVLVALAAVVAMVLVRGTADDQATEAVGVFFAALQKDDLETAYGLLCADERARVQPEDVAAEYLHEGTPEVVGSRDGKDGAQLVEVRWTDTTTELTVVSEQGAHVCGTTAG